MITVTQLALFSTLAAAKHDRSHGFSTAAAAAAADAVATLPLTFPTLHLLPHCSFANCVPGPVGVLACVFERHLAASGFFHTLAIHVIDARRAFTTPVTTLHTYRRLPVLAYPPSYTTLPWPCRIMNESTSLSLLRFTALSSVLDHLQNLLVCHLCPIGLFSAPTLPPGLTWIISDLLCRITHDQIPSCSIFVEYLTTHDCHESLLTQYLMAD